MAEIPDEGMKFFTDEIDEVLKGDIKRPTEFDKFISENPKSSDELVLSQIAWIAKTSAYIAMHLKRWAEERVIRKIDHWYRNVSNPFTKRLAVINIPCKDLLDALSARLPNLQNRFKEQCEQLLSIAKNADKEQRLGTGINNFKKAAISLHGTTLTIHSEAVAKIEQLTGNNKSSKIFGDEVIVGCLPVNYKNLWHKIKNWPCVARRIKKIRKLFRR